MPALHELVISSCHSLHCETWQSAVAVAVAVAVCATAVGCTVPSESCIQPDSGSSSAKRKRFMIWHSDLSKLLCSSDLPVQARQPTHRGYRENDGRSVTFALHQIADVVPKSIIRNRQAHGRLAE